MPLPKSSLWTFLLSGLLILAWSTPVLGKNPARAGTIQFLSNGQRDKIIIKADQKLEPGIDYLPGPARIILTFTDGILLKKVGPVAAAGRYIKRFWASQFTSRPPVFRLVAELKQKVRPTFNYDIPGQTQIIFGEDQPVAPKTEPAPATAKAPAADRPDDNKPPETASPVRITAGLPTEIITEITRETGTGSEAVWLPGLSETDLDKIRVIIKGQTMNWSRPLLIHQQILMVPAQELASALALSAYWKQGEPALVFRRDDGLLIEGRINSADLVVNEEKTSLAAPIILDKDGTIYLPLASFVFPLGLGVRWDRTSNAIQVNPRLVRLAYEKAGNIYQIHLSTSAPVGEIKTSEFNDPPRLAIDIPDLIFDLPERDLPVRDEIVRVFRSSQFDAQTCRVTVELTAEHTSYLVSSDETDRDIFVLFIPQITRITSQTTASEETVSIETNRRTAFEIKKLADPPRLMIDFPQTVYRTASLIKPAGGPVKQVRGSQWQTYPPVSRVVLDLQEDLPFETSLSDDQSVLKIKFPLPRQFTRIEEIPAAASSSLRGRIIAISPGHGGSDPGAPTYDRQQPEKYYNLVTVLKLSDALSSAGATVLLTREDDADNKLANIVRFAKSNRADILIDFHYNSSYSSKTAGTETYYYKAIDQPLASAIHQAMVKNLGLEDKGLRQVKFYTLNHSQIPAVLVEPAHVSNPQELKLIKQDAFQQKIVRAIVDGLNNYFQQARP